MPSGASRKQAFSYNGMGWRTFVSEPGTIGFGTAVHSFDAFGRPTRITKADGKAIDLTYTGVRVMKRNVKVASGGNGVEQDANWWEYYDHAGRLVRVDEPNGTKTTYQYDPRSHLSKVCQNETTSCGQVRYFNYDGRGFLTSEQNPELGLSGNGLVQYSEIDPLGHARLRTVAGNGTNPTRALRFDYDGAERVTRVRDGVSGTELKVFNYGTFNSGADYQLGKLISAGRKHFYASAGANLDSRETYNYLGREGRVSYKNVRFLLNNAARERFGQDYVWNHLGDLESQTYPRCESAALCATDSQGVVNQYSRTVKQSYAKGWLTGVTYNNSTSGTLTYRDSGMINTLTHGNGVVFTQTQDTTNMLRPGRLRSSMGATSLWDTGTNPYAYDGMGNVKTINDNPATPGVIEGELYNYDGLGRLQSARIATGHAGTYTYDVYGNLKQILDGTTPRNVDIDSATNRLTSAVATHDVEGNVTSWAGNTYKYDLFNQMTEYRTGTKTYFYVYTPSDERFWTYEAGGSASIWSLRDLDGKVLREYSAHLNIFGTKWDQFVDYTYRGNALLAGYVNPSNEQRHFDLDHLGSVRLVTNASGALTARHDYLPYGEQVSSFGEGDRKRWAGHERDYAVTTSNQDDLDYMHARHYSPRNGRFVSVDPVGGGPASPQSWNRYAYVAGSPLIFVDPDGKALKAYYLATGTFWDSTRHSAIFFHDSAVGHEVDLVFSHGGQAHGVQDLASYLKIYDVSGFPTTAYQFKLSDQQTRALLNGFKSEWERTSQHGLKYLGEQYSAMSNNCAQYICDITFRSVEWDPIRRAEIEIIDVISINPINPTIFTTNDALFFLRTMGLLGGAENSFRSLSSGQSNVVIYWTYTPPRK